MNNWTYTHDTHEYTRTFNENTAPKGEEPVYKEMADPMVVRMDVIFRAWNDFDELEREAALNGVRQKLDDCKAQRTFKAGFTHADQRELMVEVRDRLEIERLWNSKTKGGGKRGPQAAIKKIAGPMYDTFTSMGMAHDEAVNKIAEITGHDAETITDNI